MEGLNPEPALTAHATVNKATRSLNATVYL